LAELKKASVKSPEKMREYEKSRQVIRDMVNARLKKIVSLATANFGQTEQILKNLTREERLIYERLHKLIRNWKAKILEFEEQGE
jgi:DNA replication initiation complex subunit (GINS family)